MERRTERIVVGSALRSAARLKKRSSKSADRLTPARPQMQVA